MSIGSNRRVVVRAPSGIRPPRVLIALAAAAVLAACPNGAPSSPGRAATGGNADGRASAPSGLTQRLTTKVEAPAAGSPYTALLTASSMLVNTGAAPVHVSARTCLVTDADVETTARLDRLEPLISCAAVSTDTDLAPQQSVGPLEARFGVRSGPGRYTIRLRHALAPELRAEAAFQVP